MKQNILIVEDEPPLVELLRYNMESEGFSTIIATNGEDGLLLAIEEKPDIIILDWMLPKLSGLDVCRRLCEHKDTKRIPILMLTARGEEGDKVSGLTAGADDYIVKPFSPSELVARVKAILRRTSPDFGENKLEYAGIVLDLSAQKANRDGHFIHLGPTEYRLLRILIERPTRVYSREQLLDRVWGRDIYVEERTVDVHVRRLRKALNKFGGDDLIRTVRRGGYSIDINANMKD